MKNRLIFLFVSIFILNISNSLCQKSHSIEIFATPSILSFRDPNKSYIEIDDDHIKVNYFNKPSQEVGLNYTQSWKNNFGWGAGLSWKHDSHKIDIGIQRDPDDWSTSTDQFFYSIEIGNINLRVNLSYWLMEKIRFDAIINATSPYLISTNVPQYFQMSRGKTQWIFTPDSTYATTLYNYNLDLKSKGIQTRKLIPEFRFTVDIYKNLKVNFGTRIKFWESKNSYFRLNIDGFFGPENEGNNQILHKSEISTKEFSFFFGLTYDFPFRAKKEEVAK